MPQLTYFNGARCTVRRIDGALIAASASAHVPLLYQHVLSNQWDKAIRLCRFVKDTALWACLVGGLYRLPEHPVLLLLLHLLYILHLFYILLLLLLLLLHFPLLFLLLPRAFV